MNKYISVLTVLLAVTGAAQQPIITNVDKKFGTANEVVTITGAGFEAAAIVYFGTGQAINPATGSGNQIQAIVPATATSGPITVINPSSDLAAVSSVHFSIAFDHESKSNTGGTPLSTLGSPVTAESFTYDLCLCDFDGDDLLDAVVSNNESDNLTILTNTSDAAPPLFSSSSFRNNGDPVSPDGNTSHNVDCGDLNNDGRPDLVVTSQGSGEPYVHIYENTGSFPLTRRVRITLPTLTDGSQRLLKRVEIVDVDIDGKKDLVVGSFSVGEFFVYRNTSSGSISFSNTPIKFSVSGATNAGSLSAGDFDNDGRPDLVVAPTSQTDPLFIMRNQSSPGNISFVLSSTEGNQRQRVNVITGDFNNDGFIDIAGSNRTSTSRGLDVFENNGNLTFTESHISASSSSPWGIDAGDLNGDGLTDIVVTSQDSRILYFENTSSGSLSFASAQSIATNGQVRNVKVGDINADGKPDLAFTDASATTATGQFNYVLNDLCMTPVISPVSGVFCAGDDYILTATQGANVTYSWVITGDSPPIATSTGYQLNLNTEGYDADITVVVTATSGSCAVGSDEASPTPNNSYMAGPAGSGTPAITPNSAIVCAGDQLTLTSSLSGPGYTYSWTGPDNFLIPNGSTATQEVAAEAMVTMSGTYTLSVNDGNCDSPIGTVEVIVSSPPVATIESTDCNNGSFTLEVPDFSSEYDYQWKVDDANVSAGTGANTPAYTNNQTGVYTLEVIDSDNCLTFPYETEPFEVYSSSFTGPSFGATDEVCFDAQTTFQSGQTGTGISNFWEVVKDPFGTPEVFSFSGDQISVTFETLANNSSTFDWEVRLNTSYAQGNSAGTGNIGIGCSSKAITVSDDPTFAIESDNVDNTGPITKCPSENLTLGFSEIGTGDILSVMWDSLGTNVSANTLVVNEPGTYNATYTTNTGCEETVSLEIINYDDLGLTASDPEGIFSPTIVNGEVELGDGQLSLALSVDGTVTGTTWTVIEESGSATIEGTGNSVIITPETPSVTLEVSGTTAAPGTCSETERILIIGGTFLARKSFSPNGDGINDYWGIVNGSVLQGCVVYIVDQRGRTVFKTESPFEDVDGESRIWDGSFNGNEVPEGIYYFVLKCDESEQNQTGSILIAR